MEIYLTKYDWCSIWRNDKWFQPLGAKWCNQYKHDCGLCDMTYCTRVEVKQAIENYVACNATT